MNVKVISKPAILTLALAAALATVGCESGTGAKGDKGEQGAAGLPGTAGANAVGTPGAKGADGKDGTAGAAGATGATGEKGEKGESGNAASIKGSIAGVVTAAVGGAPLAGVTVNTLPLELTATTGADGSFKFADVPIGGYQLKFSKAGYLVQNVTAVGVVALNTTQLGVALVIDAAAGLPPSIVVTNNQLVGYEAQVELKPVVTDADGDVKAVTYQWLQTSGPKLALTGDKTATLSFKTLPLTSTKNIKLQRFGVLGLSPDDAGHYKFTLTATDAQAHTAKATVTVMAAAPSTGLRNLAIGLPVYLVGDGGTQTTWNWQLDNAAAPGATAVMTDSTKQYPHFTPDVKGNYTVKETVSGKSLVVYAGTWIGVMNATDMCTGCHNDGLAADKFAPWKKTRHFIGPQEKFDGISGAPGFSAACLECHTVGSSDFAKNGGFDDLATVANWALGKPAAGTWDALLKDKPEVGKLAGIQCESCHGPQGSAAHSAGAMGKPAAVQNELSSSRVSFSSQVCATCHQEAPHHYKPSQWEESGHANPALTVHATWEGRGVTAAHCGRCHSAQGFAAYTKQLKKGVSSNLTKPDGTAVDEAYLRGLGMQASTIEPQTCQACHDPHDATNPSQLRLFGAIASLPNGMTNLTGVGTGAVCMACHNTRNGEHNDFVKAPTSYSGPHAPSQTDVMYGFNAYFMPRFTPSKHLAVTDTCATCHVTIPTGSQSLAKQTANHSFKPDKTLCASCHSNMVTGEPLQAAVMLQLDDLNKAITGQVKALVTNAMTANGKITVRAFQVAGDVYSSAKDPNVDLADAPTSVELTSIHGGFSFILHLPKAVSVTWTTGKTEQITDVYVSAGEMVTLPAGGVLSKVLAPDSTVAKAVWNYLLLTGDGTNGIHNPTFYQDVMAATKAALLSGK